MSTPEQNVRDALATGAVDAVAAGTPPTAEQQAAIDLLKRELPAVFPQHFRLADAQRAYDSASRQLKVAQADWDAIGMSPPAKTDPATP